MAWETRNGKGRYYTRSRRVNGKVVREYFGCGLRAEAAARADAEARQARAERRRQEDERSARARQIEEEYRLATQHSAQVFTAAGYHCYHGEWRKKRV